MSGPVTDKSGQIVKRESSEPKVIQLLTSMKGQIAAALPRHVTPDRITRVALTALRNNPSLVKCTVPSVLGSIMTASQLGLEVNTPLGHAYLVPYRVKGVPTCQLIIGYQGYLDLARRSGMVATPMACVVRKGDLYKVAYGLYPDIKHEPSDDPDRESKQITHVYAFAHVLPKDSCPPIFVPLTRAQVLARKQRSAAVKSGKTTPWDTDEEAMFCKTGIRALWRWLPKTVEMATAASLDDRAEQGVAQTSLWDAKIIDAMAEEGVSVDLEEVTEDGEIVDDGKAPTGAAPAQETQSTPSAGGPPPPPPERTARRMREPGED
jgi:recombination protein RecT